MFHSQQILGDKLLLISKKNDFIDGLKLKLIKKFKKKINKNLLTTIC